MKKILFLMFMILPLTVFAGKEENECFKLLNESVKNDVRFQDSRIFVDGDLSKVLYDESNNSYYDFASYKKFKKKRAWNYSNGSRYFLARRNNIGTIISPNSYYAVSQITGFGRDSNFDFPLESKSGPSFGHRYRLKDGFFKEYVLYTHHVNYDPYDLMSCGIVKVTPLEGRSFSEISEAGYMTNVITGSKKQSELNNKKCSSGFEGEYLTSGGEDFYKMKSNICVQSYDESDYLKMEVISIAYDNGSDIINEYETHPIQVKAMKDHKNHANGLKGIQDEFRNDLYNQTCFRVVHGNTLPARCNPVSFLDTLKDMLLPSAHARLNDDEEDDEEFETYTGSFDEASMGPMQAYESIPYPLYKKLESIPDEKFRSYMLLSVLPNFETVINHRKENNVLLSPFEEVFLACEMSYEERLDVVLDFLSKLDADNFSLSQLDYKNEKYGNCIIPYPDKDVLDTVVEGSFSTNVLLAEKFSSLDNQEKTPESVKKYLKEKQNILDQYNSELENLESRYNKGEISASDFHSMFEENEDKFNDVMQRLNDESKEYIDETIKQQVEEIDSGNIVENRSISIVTLLSIILLLVFGGGLVIWGLNRKKNKK